MNTFYVVHDHTGQIIKAGSCPESMLAGQATQDDHTAIAVDQLYDDSLHCVIDGEVVELPDELRGGYQPEPMPEYVEARVAAYPSVEDQLDLLYHHGIEVWRETIAGIKTAHPKP